jgi:hypothetical protein
MSAMLMIEKDQVFVSVSGTLGYKVWPVLRDARQTAQARSLPLCIDVQDCSTGDMAGIGSIMLAQETLSSVKLSGCHGVFFNCFDKFGICERCSVELDNPMGCSRYRANSL